MSDAVAEANLDSRLILSLEGSSATVSAAVLRGEVLLAETIAPADQAHAERILPAIDRVLNDSNLCLDEIDAFAIAVGPGGFTSLRIAVATLKGLAFSVPAAGGRARPVAAVSTLEAMAVQVLTQIGDKEAMGRWLVPMLDARREEVYAAAYVLDAKTLLGVREVLPESVYAVDDLCMQLRPNVYLLGEGAAIVGAALCETLGPGIEWKSDFVLRASTVGKIGARMIAREMTVSVEDLAPRYLRRAEAEVKRTGLRFESTS